MKRLALLAAVAAALLLSACASTGTVKTPAEIQANLAVQMQKACAVAQPTIASMQSMQSQLTVDQQADLAKAAEVAAHVCTANLPPAPQTIAEFVQAAFPVVIKIVDASPLLPQDKALASIALTAAQIGLSAALAQ